MLYEILIVLLLVLWASWGVSFGFGNLITRIKSIGTGTRLIQSDLGRFFDGIFIILTILFVSYFNEVFDFITNILNKVLG